MGELFIRIKIADREYPIRTAASGEEKGSGRLERRLMNIFVSLGSSLTGWMINRIYLPWLLFTTP